MKFTASTIAAILAFGVAQANAHPSPQVYQGDVVDTKPPPLSKPIEYPDFWMAKRDEQGQNQQTNGVEPTGNDRNGEGNKLTDRAGFGGPAVPNWRGGVDNHDRGSGHGKGNNGNHKAHGPMPDLDVGDEQLARRGLDAKKYHWWESQTGGPFMDLVTGNPNVRNINYKESSKKEYKGIKRRDEGP